MGIHFSLLIATDSDERATELAAQLAGSGLEPAYTVVDNIHDLSMTLAEEPWDVVASDSDVPGLPWRETLALSRAVREDVPFVLFTDDDDPEAARLAMNNGADDILRSGDWRTGAVFSRLLREASRRRRLAREWERLHSDESTYRGMIEHSVLGIFQCTPWGALVTFNPSFARILGHESSEELSERMAGGDRKLPLEQDQALDALLFMIQQREFVSDFETMVRRADGSQKWVSIAARAIRGESGEISGIEGTIEDIDKRKAIEGMIISAKQEWEKTFDSVPDIIAILNDDLTLRRLNMALARHFDVHPKELVGKACSEVFDMPGEPPQTCPRIRRMARGGGQTEEMHIPALGGWFLVTVSPMNVQADKDDKGGFVLSAHDVSHRKELEARLRQSQKLEAIGTLAGGVAHDFNNILGVIMGYTEMTLEEADRGSSTHRRLTEVLGAGRRARDLIHQILTFSRQEEMDLQPLALDSVIKEAVKLLRASIPANIKINLDLQPAGTVLANLSQIHQVVMNLCTNAAHAMREGGGSLTISMSRHELSAKEAARHDKLSPGPHVRLAVTDTGHGIPQDIMDKVFDPFFTTKKPDEGTGMGLAMVHGIISGHAGAVWVSSVPDEGTTFEIYLPEAAGTAARSTPAPAPDTSRSSGVAMIVDDEKALAEIVGEMLESMGFSVAVHNDPLAALEEFRDTPERFDVVITDQTMPNLTGAELAEEMIALRPGLPVVMCTGFSEDISAENARAMGISGYLLKPVLKRDLARAVSEALNAAGQRRQQ